MALLERQIDRLLTPLPADEDVDPEAEMAEDRRRVSQALELLKVGAPPRKSGTASKPEISSELWARCAEASVRVGNMKVASECLHEFFTLNPPPNQFLARAYLCQAVVEDSRIVQWTATGRPLRGDEAVEQCLRAISFVMRGLDVATKDVSGTGTPDAKLYSFLVQNASRTWWKVSRPLRVDVLMAKLVPSLEQVLAALENADKTLANKDPAWLAQLYVCMGQCQLDAGDAGKAGTAAGEAAKIAGANDKLKILQQAYQLQIHAGMKSVPPPKPPLKVAGLLQEIASGIVVNDEKSPNAIDSVLMDALKDADPVLAAALAANPSDPKQALDVANEQDNEANEKPSQEALDLVAEVGRVAMHKDVPLIAEACARRAVIAKSLRSRVLCQYVNCGLAIYALGDEKERYTRRMVAVRLDALSQLERALQSAERLPDDELTIVQEGCVMVWNVALPLLQPNLRVQPMVQRALFRACKVLDDRDAYLHELRVTMQLELARAAVDDDFISRAEACVDKALELNYIDRDYEETGRDRPLDDRLVPLKQAFFLKTDIYNVPETNEERAVLLLENARDSKGLQAAEAKKSFLTRACQLLEEMAEESDVSPGDDVVQFRLWVDLTKQAWSSKLVDLAENGCDTVLPTSWDVVKARERVVWTAQLYFIQGEVAVARLRDAGLELAKTDDAESAQGELVTTVNESFLAAVKLGLDLKDAWIVVNGVTYLWNYYLPILREKRFAELLPELQECFDALKEINADEAVLMCHIADTLAKALEHTFLIAKQPTDEGTPPGTYDYLVTMDVTDGGAAELTQGIEVCEYMVMDNEERLAKPTPSQQKAVLESLRRLQKWKGQPANSAALPSAQAQVFTLLNVCTESLAKDDKDSASKDLESAREILKNPETEYSAELWARVALAALDAGMPSEAVDCAEQCEAAIPNGSAARKEFSENPNNWVNWRWFSVAESTHGQGLIAMLDPMRQDKTDQDKIKQNAMSHFTLAAQYGASARYPPLVEAAARHFWNASLDFQKNAVTRKILPKPMRKILDAMQNCAGPIGTKIKVRMYGCLLTCYRDAQKWKPGLLLTDEAFKNVPSTHHKSLWDERVIFMTKMGVNLLGAMLKVKEMYSERMLARVWVSVARVSTVKMDQFHAYNSAIDALVKTPWEAVDYRTEYAEWLFCNDFPIADAEDQLLAVCDMLLKVEAPDPSADEIGVQTSRSASSVGSGTRMGGTARSASTVLTTASSAPSAQSKGVARPTKLNVRYYEILVRVYTMLASITADRSQQIEYLMLAVDRVLNIWQDTSEILRDSETDPEGTGIPQHVERWPSFSVSDDLLKSMSKAEEGTGLNRATLERPELLWVYAEKLVGMLTRSGYTAHSLPVLAMLEVLAGDSESYVLVCRQRSLLRAWVHLQTATVLDSMGLCDAASDRRKRAAEVSSSFTIEPEVLKECEDEMKQRTELKNQLKEAALGGSQASLDAPADPSATPEKLLKPMSDRLVWVMMAKALLEEGFLKDSKKLLELGLRQAQIFDDDECQSQCRHYLAQVAFRQEDVQLALSLEQDAQEYNGDLELWCDSVAAYVDFLQYDGQHRASKRVLDSALTTIESIAKERPSSAAEAKFNHAQFVYRKAKLLAGPRGPPGTAFGTPLLNRPHAEFEEAIALLQQAAGELQELGADLSIVEVYSDSADLLQQKARETGETSAIQAKEILELALGSLGAAEAVVKQILINSCTSVSDRFSPPCKRVLASLYITMSEIEIKLAYLQMQVDREKDEAQVRQLEHVRMTSTLGLPKDASDAAITLAQEKSQPIDNDDGRNNLMIDWMKEQERVTAPEPLPAGGMAHDAASMLYLELAAGLDIAATTKARVLLGIGRVLRFQATEPEEYRAALSTLESCLELAREQHDDDLVAAASSEAVECYLAIHKSGEIPVDQHADGVSMIWSLASLQSCRAAQVLREDYIRASPVASPDTFALRLRQSLAENRLPPSRALCDRLQSAEAFLSDRSSAFKALRAATALGPEAVREALPENLKLVVLQHSDDGKRLLCSAISSARLDPTPPEPVEVEEGEEPPPLPPVPVCAVDVADLPHSLEALSEESAKFSKAVRQFLVSGGSAATQEPAGLESRNPRFNKAEEVGAAWAMHTAHLSEYLSPVLGAAVPADFVGEADQLVLLLDSALATLPVDAVEPFATAGSSSRDFSLGLLAHRLQGVAEEGKGEKVLDKANVGYVADPQGEGYAERAEGALAGKTGVVGSHHVPSASEYKQLMASSSAFFYFGAGSTQTVVDPGQLATTPVGAHAIMLFDGHETDLSGRAQAERDRKSSPLEKSLDRPVITAALLSLQGAKSVLCNLGAASLDANATMLTETIGSLEGGKDMGASLQAARGAWLAHAKEAAVAAVAEPEAEAEAVDTGSFAAFNAVVFGLPHIAM
eukprot:COSAG04_NODE_159_length_22103_cov_21.289389_4_plen_2414_part_00